MFVRELQKVSIARGMDDVPDNLGRRLHSIGREKYKESFEESRNLLLGSLYIQFVECKILTDLYKVSVDGHYRWMDHYLLTTASTSVVEKVPPEKRFEVAQTLRWLGHCYQNLKAYKGAGEGNQERFDFLYGTAEALLLLVDTEESKLELAELYYNTKKFLHLLKYPGDIEGACATYGKAYEINRTPQMLARILNMRYILRGEKSADTYKTTILEVYRSSENPDPYQIALFYHNYAKCLIEEERYEEADEALKPAIAYAESNSGHYYDTFYETLAELRMKQGRPTEAAAALKIAAEHAARNPD